MFAKWILNMQLGTLTKNLSKTVVSHLLFIKQQKRYKKEHKYGHSSSPAILELLHYMFKLLKPELMKYLTTTSHSASL